MKRLSPSAWLDTTIVSKLERCFDYFPARPGTFISSEKFHLITIVILSHQFVSFIPKLTEELLRIIFQDVQYILKSSFISSQHPQDLTSLDQIEIDR